MTNNSSDAPNSSPIGARLARRTVVGIGATTGALIGGSVLAQSAQASGWVTPALKTAFGAPAAAASGGGTFTISLAFTGEQTVTDPSGSGFALPAALVLRNSGTGTSLPTGTRITLTTSTSGFPMIDTTAGAASAAINGAPAGPVVTAADAQTVLVGIAIEAGSAISVPLVAALTDSFAPDTAGTITASYTTTSGTDATPAGDRVATAAIVPGASRAPARPGLSLQGERTTLRGPDGKVYTYPAALIITNGADAADGTLLPIPAGTLVRGYPEQEWSPGNWDGEFSNPLIITSGVPLLNGVPAPDAGRWDRTDSAVPEGGFTVSKPLAQGDTLEFALYAERPASASTWTAATRYSASVTGGVSATAPLSQSVGTPLPAPFDAGIAFVGSQRVGALRSVPTAVELTAVTGTIPAGTMFRVIGNQRNGLYPVSVGALTVNGAPASDVAVVSWDNAWPSVWPLIVVSRALPAGAVLSAALTWEVAPLAQGKQTVTAELIADGDSVPSNNTAARATTF